MAEVVGLALVTTPVGAVAWAPAPAPAPAPSDDASGTPGNEGPPPSSPPPSSDPVETVEDPATVLESEEVEPEEVEPEPFAGDPAEALLAPGQTMPRTEEPAPAPAPSQPPERDVRPSDPEPKHKGTALLYPGLGLIVGGILTSNVSLYIDDEKHPGLADWGGISGSLAMLSGVVLTVWGSIRVARYRKWKKRNPQAVGLAPGRGSAGTRTLGLSVRF